MSGNAHRIWIRPGARRHAPALFLDRDGTIIEDRHYLADPAGVTLIAGAAETLAVFQAAGFALVIVTNQSGVGRGFFGWAEQAAVAEAVRATLAAAGVEIDAELTCGHAPDQPCDWRKPAAGMLQEAAGRLGLDLASSVMVGDKASDIAAGSAAGVGRLVRVGGEASPGGEALASLADLRP